MLHLVDGAVAQLDSVRGSKRVMQLMEEGIAAALEGETQRVALAIGHILREEDAATFKANLEAALHMTIPNPVTEVGVTIGTHAGLGALVVAYCKKYETFVR